MNARIAEAWVVSTFYIHIFAIPVVIVPVIGARVDHIARLWVGAVVVGVRFLPVVSFLHALIIAFIPLGQILGLFYGIVFPALARKEHHGRQEK